MDANVQINAVKWGGDMDRRDFLRLFGTASAAGAALRLTGCGAGPVGLAQLRGTTRKVQVYDLVMEGWSTLGSGYLGENGILTAAKIVAFKDLPLDYVQDPHGHRFVLTQAELAKIMLGQVSSVLTTYALDHRHEVRCKPSHRAPHAKMVEVEIDEDGHPVVNP